MGIVYSNSDIWLGSHDVVVVSVNCKGAMGKGLALQCRNLYPDVMDFYIPNCHRGTLKPGGIIWYENPILGAPDLCLVATKDHWRNPSQLEWIHSIIEGISDATRNFPGQDWGIPPLGCGLGGLDFSDVNDLLYGLRDLDGRFTIYIPKDFVWDDGFIRQNC